jgi:serine/threonine protein kinase
LSKIIQGDYYDSTEFCGTHAYLAPEMILQKEHGKSIDWYGVGALLYELLVGVPPFFSNDEQTLYNNILHGHLIIPSDLLSPDCADLIKRLLRRNPLERLGAREGFKELSEH